MGNNIRKISSLLLTALSLLASTSSAQTNLITPNVVVWGDNSYGQTNVPQDLTNAVAVANPGMGFCLAIRSDGTVSAWGTDDYGQCDVPANLSNVISVAASDYASFALKSDGTVVSWGTIAQSLYFGNIPPDTSGFSNVIAISAGASWFDAITANGSFVTYRDLSSVPSTLTNAVSIACGQTVDMVVQANGKLFVWGDNTYGQTNLPLQARISTFAPIAIANGSTHCLALFTNSIEGIAHLNAWGENSSGQLNAPDFTGSNIVALAAGDGFSLELTSSGVVIGWGSLAVPPNLPSAQAIAAGNFNAMAIVNPTQAGSPPTIFTQPKSQTVAGGSNLVLFVGALGFLPVTYQWYFNSTNLIVGATQSVLVVTNIQVQQSGQYTVAVSNGAGTKFSQPANVNVLTSLLIYTVPAISISGGIGSTFNIQYINTVGPTNQAWTTLATVTLTNSPEFYPDYSGNWSTGPILSNRFRAIIR